ncbi:MAG: elongation factor 1-beta [Methanomicrobiales archaeon]|nr:elongation factor 1-beta [Methanomicrobiales archaeon]
MQFPGALKMGKVLAIMRVMPASVDVDLKGLTAELRRRVPQIRDVAEEPIAFGLKAIKLAVVVGDEEGGTDAIEGSIASVKDVASVEIIDLDRLL